MTTIGGLLKDLRIQKNISQTQIAYQMGWSDSSQLSRIEQGKTKPSKEMLTKIVLAMNLNAQESANLYLAGGYLPSNEDILNAINESAHVIQNWPYPAMVLSLDWKIIAYNQSAKDLYKINQQNQSLLETLFNKDFLLQQKNNPLYNQTLANKLEVFKFLNSNYADQGWYKDLVKKLIKNKVFKKIYSQENTQNISNINYEKMDLLINNILLSYHIFKKPLKNDARFFYEFHNPANKQTMEFEIGIKG